MTQPTDPVRRIFDETMQRPVAARADFVRRACGGDEELRNRVERLIESLEHATRIGFLDHPTGGGEGPERQGRLP